MKTKIINLPKSIHSWTAAPRLQTEGYFLTAMGKSVSEALVRDLVNSLTPKDALSALSYQVRQLLGKSVDAVEYTGVILEKDLTDGLKKVVDVLIAYDPSKGGYVPVPGFDEKVQFTGKYTAEHKQEGVSANDQDTIRNSTKPRFLGKKGEFIARPIKAKHLELKYSDKYAAILRYDSMKNVYFAIEGYEKSEAFTGKLIPAEKIEGLSSTDRDIINKTVALSLGAWKSIPWEKYLKTPCSIKIESSVVEGGKIIPKTYEYFTLMDALIDELKRQMSQASATKDAEKGIRYNEVIDFLVEKNK